MLNNGQTPPESGKNGIVYRAAPDATPVNIKPLEGVVEGYPIVFGVRTQIGNFFTEEIDPHALDGADLTDIKFMVNHNDGMIPLARHRRGKRSTMDAEVTAQGLHINARLDVQNNSTARELCSAVDLEDIGDMSFAFGVKIDGDEWSGLDTDLPHRRITKISKVFEVSAVNDGAYPQTSIYARSAALDNAKSVLEQARTAAALDNEKRAAGEQAALRLAKEKFLFKEGLKNL